MPTDYTDRRYYFDADLSKLSTKDKYQLTKYQRYLQQNLVYNTNSNRIGTLLFCLEYANDWDTEIGMIWEDVVKVFSTPEMQAIYPVIDEMYIFCNKHVAHVDEPLTDGTQADAAMKQWVAGLSQLSAVVQGTFHL